MALSINNGNAYLTTRHSTRLQLELGAEDEGSLLFQFKFTHNGDGIEPTPPSICIWKRGYVWMDFDALSKKAWQDHRPQILQCLSKFSKENIIYFLQSDASRGDGTLALIGKKKDNSELLLALFNRLGDEDKINILIEHKNSAFAINTCIKCFECAHFKKHCIHHGCPGLCFDCFKMEDGDVCPACNKEQTIPCPVCKDDKTTDELYKLKCNHSVCWKCFGMSVGADVQINKCPLCRENIA